MHLRFDATPNVNAIKVTAPQPFCAGSRIISSPEKAESELEKALIALPGVKSLFFMNDFCTVTRLPDADWDDVLPKVQAAVDANLS